MKKFIFATIILAITLSIIIVNTVYMENTTGEMCKSLEASLETNSLEQYETAIN